MPVTFDFLTAGPNNALTSVTGPNTVTNADIANAGAGQTVTFTVSSDAAGGAENIFFGNAAFPAFPFYLDDADNTSAGTTADDVFTLTFADDNNSHFTVLTGKTGNRISLQFGSTVAGSVLVELLNGTAVVGSTTATALLANNTVSFTAPSITGIRFTTTGGGRDVITLRELSANGLNCFLTGTRIGTPDGTVEVETLVTGDRVLTADGRDVEVRWLGRQFVDTRVTHPAKVNPICISAGALAEGAPERNLYVSPDHAIELDGFLINAGALVNGESIYQVRNMPLDGFTYYHVETDAHELLLAEGCPAESFLDYSVTFGFDNAGERAERVIPEMDRPRISAARMVPETLTSRLKARAADMSVCRLAG